MPPLVVRVMPVARLKPARYNPRQPLTVAAYKKLRASIETFGLVEPLVWNETSGRLVGGHARFRILKKLGYKEIPVSVVRLDPARERALNVVLNNQEAQGRYDPKKLAAVLRSLRDLPEMESTGFALSALRALDYTRGGDPAPAADAETVSVTIEIPRETFPKVEPKLDRLVREYDLVSHMTDGRKEQMQPQRRRELRGSQRRMK
jgi:ParB-like chromosome segregation protein Spo0J